MFGRYIERLRNQPKKVRFLVSRLLRHSHICRLLTISRDGYVLRFYPTALSCTYWFDPQARDDDEHVLAEFLGVGDTFVDVGANIGALTLKAASLVGSGGRVVSFEPDSATFGYLCGNCRLNRADHVKAYQCALGEKPGEVHFSRTKSDDQNCIADEGAGAVTVRRLDGVIVTGTWIKLLKIDVEGFELFVLRGAGDLLATTETIYFESWERHYSKYGYSTGEVLSFLREAGFVIHRMGRKGWQAITGDYVSAQCENLLARRV